MSVDHLLTSSEPVMQVKWVEQELALIMQT